MPHVIVIAGPNGAGKSTTAPNILEKTLGINEFVNADVIAQGLSAFNPEKAAFHAGRIMLERIQQLAKNGDDFAFETTLASKSFAPWLKRLKLEGYTFSLLFFWLSSPESAIGRVAERVRDGGHHVPAETIHRRYHSGLKNFFSIYMPIADIWRMYDNSAPGNPLLLSHGEHTIIKHVGNIPRWEMIMGRYYGR